MTTRQDMRTPLKIIRGYGTVRSGTDHFWRQRMTAVSNLFLVLFFVGVIFSLAGAGYRETLATIGSPAVAILLILAVLSVTTHMRIGMQVILEDYIHHEGARVALVILNTFYTVFVAFACIFAIVRISLISFGVFNG